VIAVGDGQRRELRSLERHEVKGTKLTWMAETGRGGAGAARHRIAFVIIGGSRDGQAKCHNDSRAEDGAF